MAITIDEISALTEKLWVPVIADNTFLSNPLFARLWQRGPKEQGGTAIHAPIMYAKVASAGAIRGFEPMLNDASDEFSAANWDWKEYYAAIILSRREMFQNSGEPEVIDHLSAKSQAAEMTLRDLLGIGLHSDGLANTRLIDGLNAVISTTNTYPNSGGGSIGFDRATEIFWRAGFRDVAAKDFTVPANVFGLLQRGVGLVTQQPNSPTMIVTSQAVFNDVMLAYDDNQRFEDSALASLGFDTILFRRIPIVVDSHVPVTDATHDFMYFLNENFLQLYTLKDENFRFAPFREPINQKAIVGYVFWTGNIICNNPRFQGVYTNATHT